MSPTDVTRIKLLSAHCDAQRRLRLSELFTWFQEAAIRHTEALGMGREKTLDRGLLWIVTQWRADIARLPEYDEEVVLTSWPGETMHVIFPRFFKLESAAGETLVTASSLWALMDRETRRAVFPDEAGIRIDGHGSPDDPALPSAPKACEAAERSVYTVSPSVLDLNGHMNNTRYFDLAVDLLYPHFGEQTPRTILCEYNSEARLGDRLELSLGLREELCVIRGEKAADAADGAGARPQRVFGMNFVY